VLIAWLAFGNGDTHHLGKGAHPEELAEVARPVRTSGYHNLCQPRRGLPLSRGWVWKALSGELVTGEGSAGAHATMVPRPTNVTIGGVPDVFTVLFSTFSWLWWLF